MQLGGGTAKWCSHTGQQSQRGRELVEKMNIFNEETILCIYMEIQNIIVSFLTFIIFAGSGQCNYHPGRHKI